MVDVEVRTLAPATTIAARLETTTDQLSSVFDAELPRVGARSEKPDGAVAGDGPWEVYLTDPGGTPDPGDLLTEVVWPLVHAEGS